MPWNNAGPGPQGNVSASNGDGNGQKPPHGPWGSHGGPPGGQPGGPPGGPKKGRPEPERGPRKPNGPFGGGGNPFGGGPFGGGPGKGMGPDLDRLIADLQNFVRGLMGGGPRRVGPGMGSGGPLSGGRGFLFLALVIVLLWVGSGFYRVQPDEQGVVLRFGAYSYWTPPGLHWHLPWPIESVQRPTVTRINRTEIGYRSSGATRMEDGQDAAGRDVLAESLMLTGDENIIDIDVAVFWRVNNASDFLFNTAHPEVLVRAVAESSMREVIGRTPIQPALGPMRGQIESDVLKQTQSILDSYHAGVEVTQVQLQKVDPPEAVIESFRDVQRANTDAERMRNEADAYRNDIVPRARGDAARVVAEAEGAKQASVAQATGETQRFESVLRAYQAAKEVTLTRLYLDAMRDVLINARPLVVDDKLKGLVPYLPLTLPPPAQPTPTPNPPAAAPSAGQTLNQMGTEGTGTGQTVGVAQ